MVLALTLAVAASAATPAWELVWGDEFGQPDGSAPASTNWVYDLGGGGWGNNELETYTNRRENSRIEGGTLVIEARKETFTGSDNVTRDYTSARLKTLGKQAWTHGRIEARMKLPYGQGIWPAFWMMGTDLKTVGWPKCGEIDIMENIGREPSTVHGTVHGPGYSGGNGIGGGKTLSGGQKLADDFHVYAIEWETNRIRWFYDNQLYFTVTPANLPADTKWVFDHPHFILLNLAVGGNWPGKPDATTVFPQKLLVDYVRVYAASETRPSARLERTGSQARLRWPVTLPQAVIETTPSLPPAWTFMPVLALREGVELHASVGPGFYRLRW
jgi:beta-glucanase (GH16 family)